MLLPPARAVGHSCEVLGRARGRSGVQEPGWQRRQDINNRFEEALGPGTDTWAAQKKLTAYGDVPPWLGYVFVLREDDETECPDRPIDALFPADSTFKGMSYNQRYQEMLRRFMGDNIYQAGWFITTKTDDEGRVSYVEPLATASGKVFRVAVQGRVNYVRSVLD